ncbi:MAG TPA: nucleoside-triphosphatase [Chloroflexia bacterium]|jgi:nucleoside-triphosphatase THEP1
MPTKLSQVSKWVSNNLPDLSTILLIVLGIVGAIIGVLDLFLDFQQIPGLKEPAAIILLLVALLLAAVGVERKVTIAHERADLKSRLKEVEDKIGTVDSNVIDVDEKVSTSIEHLDTLLKQLKQPSADNFFTTSTSESHLIKQAVQEAMLIQETGSQFLEDNRELLSSILNRGGRVRILLSLPRDATARLMAFRNNDQNIKDILNRSSKFQSHLKAMKEDADQHLERLEIRYTPYPTETTAVIVDPEHPEISNRKAVIRFAGFRVPYRNKLDFTIDAITSPKIFHHYVQDCNRLYQHASKVILLTGEPKIGKTNMLHSIVKSNLSRENLYYVLSKAKWEGGERTGFEVVTSTNQRPQQFAARRDNGEYNVDTTIRGKYKIDTTIWVPIVEELAEAHKQGKVIVLDEIGPMQLEVPGFRDVVEAIMNNIGATLFASVTLDNYEDDYLPAVKQHHRSTLLHLTPENETKVRSVLNGELRASLRVAEILPCFIEEPAK